MEASITISCSKKTTKLKIISLIVSAEYRSTKDFQSSFNAALLVITTGLFLR